MESKIEDTGSLSESLQCLLKEQKLFAKVIECFPYPIQIFSRDGTAQLINKAALDMIGIKSVEDHVGNYNVFEDPIVRDLGFLDKVKQVLEGEITAIALLDRLTVWRSKQMVRSWRGEGTIIDNWETGQTQIGIRRYQ